MSDPLDLDAYNGKEGGVIEVVGGPHPYLWIGSREGECFGTLGGSRKKERARLVALRDALTRELRRR